MAESRRDGRALDHTKAPPLLPPTLGFDLLNVKRMVELHVDRISRDISLYAQTERGIKRVEIPGSRSSFNIGHNDPALVLELIRMITGKPFELAINAPAEIEVWVRTDYASRFITRRRQAFARAKEAPRASVRKPQLD